MKLSDIEILNYQDTTALNEKFLSGGELLVLSVAEFNEFDRSLIKIFFRGERFLRAGGA